MMGLDRTRGVVATGDVLGDQASVPALIGLGRLYCSRSRRLLFCFVNTTQYEVAPLMWPCGV